MSEDLANIFFVKNCSLAAIATGEKASSLVELRDQLTTVDESCLYYHFWGARLNPKFVHPQYHNDFADWVYQRLHDQILAEKLSIIDPTDYNLESLRQELIDTVERRLDDYEIALWTRKEDQFHFIRSTTVVFEKSVRIERPEDLPQIIETLSPGSIFYHFIDARRRTIDKIDDFSVWLKMFGQQYTLLIEKIQAIDPYFLSLTEVRDELVKIAHRYFRTIEIDSKARSL